MRQRRGVLIITEGKSGPARGVEYILSIRLLGNTILQGSRLWKLPFSSISCFLLSFHYNSCLLPFVHYIFFPLLPLWNMFGGTPICVLFRFFPVFRIAWVLARGSWPPTSALPTRLTPAQDAPFTGSTRNIYHLFIFRKNFLFEIAFWHFQYLSSPALDILSGQEIKFFHGRQYRNNNIVLPKNFVCSD